MVNNRSGYGRARCRQSPPTTLLRATPWATESPSSSTTTAAAASPTAPIKAPLRPTASPWFEQRNAAAVVASATPVLPGEHNKRTPSIRQIGPTGPISSRVRCRTEAPPAWSFMLSLTAAVVVVAAFVPHGSTATMTTQASELAFAGLMTPTTMSTTGTVGGGGVALRSNANVSTDEAVPAASVSAIALIAQFDSADRSVVIGEGTSSATSRSSSGSGSNVIESSLIMTTASSHLQHVITGNNYTSTEQAVRAAQSAVTAGVAVAAGREVPQNEIVLQIFLVSIFCMLIVLTVIGNTLVILSVLTTRRLRTVTNCFVMSLAVADWLVGLFVMPPAVAVYILKTWTLGRILCDIWISLDVLLCTASILSLCAISIDRYLAVTQPLNYSRRRRSKRLALLMILVVWVLAIAITCPPILGWYEQGGNQDPADCHYNQNKPYVVYSAMGSFFIPMLVMIYVYVQISCVIARRHDHMSEIEVHKKCHRSKEVDVAELEIDVDNVSEPEPSSPRRITRQMPGTASAKQELGMTSSGGSNASGCSSNFNKNYKNAQYELVDGVGGGIPGHSHAQAMTTVVTAPPVNHHHHQQQHQSRQMSTYRNNHHHSSSNNNNNAEHWYNSTTSSNNSGAVGGGGGGGGVKGAATSSNLLDYGPTTKTNNIRVHQKSMSNRILSLKRENKTTQTLAIVVGGFIACWLPFFIVYLITPFLDVESQLGDNAQAFLTWLGWFNSAMNPFIYALYSVDFRAAFWRLTCRRFCKNMRKTPYASNTYSIRRN